MSHVIKGYTVTIPRNSHRGEPIKATVKKVIEGVAMVLPWDTGNEELYRTSELKAVKK